MSEPTMLEAAVRVPNDLSELDRWAVWRLEGRKVPYRTDGQRASSTAPGDWGELAEARAALRKGKYSGLAFALFAEDGLCGIDLDDCLDPEANVKPWARGIVERFADTYTEVSPSGRGLKLWARGSLPANVANVRVEDGGIELYDHARYFTFTGQAFRGAPLQVEDHGEDLKLLYGWLTRSKRRTWPLQPLQGGRIPYGQQHSTLVSLAGTLRARHLCDEAIEACLQIVNARQCERPGARENIARIVRSSRTWGAA